MKIFLTIWSILFVNGLIAQTIAAKEDIEEYNFFYSDSAFGQFVYGDYEPKDMLNLKDGSLIVGTQFSIFFPSQNETPAKYDSVYFVRYKAMSQKTHVSSGSVFKLNSRFEKEWETVFKEQRIERVLKTKDERLLVVGEEVSMKFVWVAELDQAGKILWEKHYKYKNQVTISDAIIDENDAVYLFLESSHIIPIQYKKKRAFEKGRLHFFRDSEINSHLAILKITSTGKKIWLKPIDTKRKKGKYSYQLVSGNRGVFASYISNSFKKNQLIEEEKIVHLSEKGKITSEINFETQDLLFYENGLVTITSYSKGDLVLYRSGNTIDSTSIKSARQDIRIEKAVRNKANYLIWGSNHDNNRDYLLIPLHSDLKFGDYWTYPRDEYNETRGAVVLENGQVLVIGKCYKENKDESNKLVTYINLIKVKKGVEIE